jgi:hypothetical protein
VDTKNSLVNALPPKSVLHNQRLARQHLGHGQKMHY